MSSMDQNPIFIKTRFDVSPETQPLGGDVDKQTLRDSLKSKSKKNLAKPDASSSTPGASGSSHSDQENKFKPQDTPGESNEQGSKASEHYDNESATENIQSNSEELRSESEYSEYERRESGSGSLSDKIRGNSESSETSDLKSNSKLAVLTTFEIDTRADQEEEFNNKKIGRLNEKEIQKLERFAEINEFKIHLSYTQFFEFFFYHIIFFFFLGPFMNFPMCLMKSGKYIMSNLGFSPDKPAIFLAQTGFWLLIVICQALYIYEVISKTESSINAYEMESLYVSLFLRCVYMSSKYGSFSSYYIKLLKSKKLTWAQISNRFLLKAYWSQPYETIAFEFLSSLRRNNVDVSNFELNFLGEIPGKRYLALDDIRRMESEVMKEVPLEMNRVDNIYPAEYVGKDLLINSHNRIRKQRYVMLFFFILIVRSQIPNVIRVLHDKFYFGSSWADIICCLIINFVFTLNMILSLSMLLTGLFELKVRRNVLQQMSHMISPFKNVLIPSFKMYPTLNMMYPMAVKSWFNLRLTLSTYGECYFNRTILTLIGFTVWALIKIIYLCMVFLGLIPWVKSNDLFVLYSCSLVEIVPVVILVLASIHSGANINSQFKIHVKLLDDTKKLLTLLRLNSDLYFNDNVMTLRTNKTKKEASEKGSEESFSVKSKKESMNSLADIERDQEAMRKLSPNPYIRMMQKHFLKENLSRGEIERRLCVLEVVIESSQETLLLNEDLYPQKIIFLKLTYELFYSVIGAFVSLGLVMLEVSLGTSSS